MKKFFLNEFVWIPSATILFIWTASLWLCSTDARVALDEFQGVWKTTDANYEDRFFEISESTIAFGTGNGKQELDINGVVL